MGLNAPLDCEMLEVLTATLISQIEAAMTTVTHLPKKGYRTIRLPLVESEYDRFLSNRAYAKVRLDELYEDFPELFPEAFPWGYALYGFTEPSIKQEIRCRRMRLEQGQAVFTIVPAFAMPYMTGRTQEVDDALFLMRFHVPRIGISKGIFASAPPRTRFLGPRQLPCLPRVRRHAKPLVRGAGGGARKWRQFVSVRFLCTLYSLRLDRH
jgi:hypothetical protein